MERLIRFGLVSAVVQGVWVAGGGAATARQNQSATAPNETATLAAMKKAAGFMMDTVSNHGGFLWRYSADLSEQWGEIPARKTQVWVEDPGTVAVGAMFLDVWKATGDPLWLQDAKRVANCLVQGQHPAGGWHYLIDFDMPSIQKYYDEVASKCWGWEEFYHYYGNCTFDHGVTSGAAHFLLDLYHSTGDPDYRAPLLKALDFVLVSQYPNGGWPQRYPLSHEYPHDGHEDHTSFYTFKSGAIRGNIYLLMEAFEKLGDEKYRKAAYRGMDFVILAQLPRPQAGWGQQYDMNMHSAPARSYEPASVRPDQTITCIRDLERFYQMTGDRRYLQGIPDAIQWLKDSIINTDPSKNYTHATFYELGTNKPLYAHREGTSIENGRYWVDYTFGDLKHYPSTLRVDLDAIEREYKRVNAFAPKKAMSEYAAQKDAKPRAPLIRAETAANLIGSLDPRGAWIADLRIRNYQDTINGPTRALKGIETAVFTQNMNTLLNYWRNLPLGLREMRKAIRK